MVITDQYETSYCMTSILINVYERQRMRCRNGSAPDSDPCPRIARCKVFAMQCSTTLCVRRGPVDLRGAAAIPGCAQPSQPPGERRTPCRERARALASRLPSDRAL